MTLQSIKDKLVAEGVAKEHIREGKIYHPDGMPEMDVLPVHFVPAKQGNVTPKPVTFELEKVGEDDYDYYGSVPFILREPPATTTQPRDFHFPMATVIAWFGNTGKTLLDPDEVNLSRDGKFDRVTARLIVTENAKEIVTHFEALVNKDAQGNAIVRQVK